MGWCGFLYDSSCMTILIPIVIDVLDWEETGKVGIGGGIKFISYLSTGFFLAVSCYFDPIPILDLVALHVNTNIIVLSSPTTTSLDSHCDSMSQIYIAITPAPPPVVRRTIQIQRQFQTTRRKEMGAPEEQPVDPGKFPSFVWFMECGSNFLQDMEIDDYFSGGRFGFCLFGGLALETFGVGDCYDEEEVE